MADQAEPPRRPEPEPAPTPQRFPNPFKYVKKTGPRPSELKRRGELNIEDYIPDENGRQRRYG